MRALRTVHVQRYVTPLREGGSLPAIVDADDGRSYVLKFRGAGQGEKVLVAEVVAGELARALGLPVPELAIAELDPQLGRNEPDYEIRMLLKGSGGANLAMAYLAGALAFDPAIHRVDPLLAASIVWFDALIGNVDRTARNTNMLMWNGGLQLIDHGASLTFHHHWASAEAKARSPFPAIRDHVLLKQAHELRAADEALAPRVTPALVREIVELVPDAWLVEPERSPAALRDAYVAHFAARLAAPRDFVEEAERAWALV
jgi:hypothetical protein